MRLLNLIRNTSNWWVYLPVKLGLSRRDPLVFRSRTGVRIEVPRRLLQTFKEVFMGASYDTWRAGSLRAAPTIVDVGANAGFFSLYMASRFPEARILAFEPVPVNFSLLERNFRANPDRRLTPVNRAVFSSADHITLNYDASDAFTTAASIFENVHGSDEIRVEAISLPQILQEYEIDEIDYLKLDCEGAEYDILYRCPRDSLRKVRQITLEVHEGRGPRESFDDLERFLEGQGFRTSSLKRRLLWGWRE